MVVEIRTDWLQAAKRTIARVDIELRAAGGGTRIVPSGTAFQIDASHVVTAAHVLRGNSNASLRFTAASIDRERSAKLVWTHPGDFDLAVLELNEQRDAPLYGFGRPPSPGDKWTSFGYPRSQIYGHTIRDEKINDPEARLDFLGGLAVIQLETPLARFRLGGMSGAPCFVDQKVVGVITSQLVEAKGRRTAPYLNTLFALPRGLLDGIVRDLVLRNSRLMLLPEYLKCVLALCEAEPVAIETYLADGLSAPASYVEVMVSGHKVPPNTDLGQLQSRPQPIDVFLKTKVTKCWALLGDPGSGKSTLLNYLAYQHARLALEPASFDGMIPLRVRLPDIAEILRSTDLPSLAWFLADLRARDDRIGNSHMFALSEAAKEGRLLFLFDGMDEVRPEFRGTVTTFLRNLSMSEYVAKGCRIVVASRHLGYSSPSSEFLRLELVPLAPDRQLQLIKKWLSRWEIEESIAERIHTGIQNAKQLAELAGNPFILTLMVLLTLEKLKSPHQGATGDVIGLPRRRSALLAQALDLLVRGCPRSLWSTAKHLTLESPDLVKKTLSHVAYQAMHYGPGPYKRELLTGAAQAAPTYYSLKLLVSRWRDCSTFLDDVASRTGILVPSNYSRTDFQFMHRALQERLAALRLSELPAEAWKEYFASISREGLGSWGETFALLADDLVGREADDLLLKLSDANGDLALRALGAIRSADSLQRDTIVRLLKREDDPDLWEGRAERYEAIPILTDWSQCSANLLNTLRTRTTHGADLWFIRKALLELSSKGTDADARRLSKSILDSFFDHLAAPPDLETQVVHRAVGDRCVHYWCDVIGFAYPFKAAVVPITNRVYEIFDPSHRGQRDPSKDDHPVVRVTWYEAMMFCSWLESRYTGVRLPTVREWSFAAGKFDPAHRSARYGGMNGTIPVGSSPEDPGRFGTLDQYGNVWEYCLPEESHSGTHHPARGGCFSSPELDLTADASYEVLSSSRNDLTGFRVVRAPGQENRGRE